MSISKEKLEKELLAQKRRAAAVAYLEKQGQRVDVSGPMSSAPKPAHTDNTLELLLRQKATSSAATSSCRLKESQMKEALLKQQMHVRENGVSSSSTGAASCAVEKSIPHGWKEIFDEVSSRHYYWNTKTNETSWQMPQTLTTATDHNGPGVHQPPLRLSSDLQIQSLLPDWDERVHPATGQIFYINKITNERTSSRPGVKSSPDNVTEDRGISTSNQVSNDKKEHRRVCEHSGKLGKRMRAPDIDPLDPTGGKGDKRANALADKMADSTASGPLWQQRPYPAPGQILRSKPGITSLPIQGPSMGSIYGPGSLM